MFYERGAVGIGVTASSPQKYSQFTVVDEKTGLHCNVLDGQGLRGASWPKRWVGRTA